ncbi:hypothetical protein GH5_07842 [Leishmania sp. Ghana 2012 LV757]|uniref:hypothetical protein n=1 Tax=Leishmania sp. Ghana 2012 LV757 TaxID=2803181 RepID=UPI001B503E01|nr:hypothetical protein GH5_07842 [Leishmania sp. Ghana 2012 LV757]
MKSTRTTAKSRWVRLPYSTTVYSRHHPSSVLSRVARGISAVLAKATFLRQPRSLEQRGVSGVAASPLPSSSSATLPALAPGDILRDIAFFTQASEVNFFSTHPSLCAQMFGVVPGEIFEMGGGCAEPSSGAGEAESGSSIAGEAVVVVGARGGRLWVWAYGAATARVLPVPERGASATPSTAAEVRAVIVEHYQLRQLAHPSRAQCCAGSLKAREQDAQAELTRTVYAAFQCLCARAHEEAQRLYTPDQIAFLQCAPDLYVAAPKRGDRVTTASAAAVDAAGEDSESQQQQQQPSDHMPPLPSSSTILSSIYTDIARHAPNAAAVVLLAPRVELATGVVGWVGEGDVVLIDVLAGEEGYGEASLSASVVI